MPLTELQLPTKQTLYNQLQVSASEMNELMHRWADIASFVNSMTTADLDAIGVPTDDNTRSDMVDYRNAILEMVSFWNGNSVTPVKPPVDVVGKIRRMTR